jgi:hypothetical protein
VQALIPSGDRSGHRNRHGGNRFLLQRTHEGLELPRMETTRRSGSTTTHIRKDL